MDSYKVLMWVFAFKTHIQGRAMSLITDWLIHIWDLLQVRGWWFAVGLVFCVIAGFLPLKVKKTQKNSIPVGAVLLGALLPVCNFAVIPLAVALRMRGLRIGTVFAFLSAAVLLNPSGVLSAWAYMGPKLTIAWGFGALLVSLAVGMAETRLLPPADHEQQVQLEKKIFLHTFLQSVPELALWLVLGVLVQALLQVMMPKDLWQTLLLNPAGASFGDAAAAALARHVCIPDDAALAASLTATGFPPGWAVLLLTFGICTNLPELFVLYGMMGKRPMALYTLVTLCVSVAAGILTQLLIGPGFVPQFSLADAEPLIRIANLLSIRTWMPARGACAAALLLCACCGLRRRKPMKYFKPENKG